MALDPAAELAHLRTSLPRGGRSPSAAAARRLLEQTLEEIETRAMESRRGGLRLFVERAWPVLEPASPFAAGYHVDAIAAHLEAVQRGEIKDLLILIPPRFGKPVWEESWVMLRRGRTLLKDVRVGDEILTHRGRYRRVLAVHEQGELPLLRLETFSGRVVRTAPDHPFLTTRGWVEARHLIVEPPYKGQTSRSTSRSDRLAYIQDGFESAAPSPLTPEAARLLGYLVGDGCTKFASVVITNADIDVLTDVMQIAQDTGLRVSRIGQKKPSGRAHTCDPRNAAWSIVLAGVPVPKTGVPRSSRGPLQQWLIHHGLLGKGSAEKRVPTAVLQSSNAVIAEFLGAYWACDGCLQHRGRNRNDYHVSAVTISPGLADDLQHLLLRLGIKARVRRSIKQIARSARNAHKGTDYPVYTISVESQHDMWLFAQRVPIRHSQKKHALEALRATEFDRALLAPDVLVSSRPDGTGRCRCLTVEEDETFTANDLVVHNSILSCVIFPSWIWGPMNRPSSKWMFNTYRQDLSLRDSGKRRTLMSHSWYQHLWGNRFSLGTDRFRSDSAVRYENDHAGFHLATSVGGGNIGEGADFLMCVPGETQITTNSGPLSIDAIVEGRLPVCVLGASGQWRAITAYHRNPGRPLLEITLTNGVVLRCTENHPLWTEEHGFIPARDVINSVNGSVHLRCLRDGFQPSTVPRGTVSDRPLLFSPLLRRLRARAAESIVGRRLNSLVLRALRQGGRAGEALKPSSLQVLLAPLSPTHRACEAAAGVSSLLRPVHSCGASPAVLWPDLRQSPPSGRDSRAGQRTLCAGRLANSLRARLHREGAPGHRREGRSPLRRLWQGATDYLAGASPRWVEGPARIDQSGDALRFLPSPAPQQVGCERDADAAVGIAFVRRLPAPDAVYNLTVDVDHTYYANGVLTHNCDDANNLNEIHSEIIREAVIRWWCEIMATRRNNDKAARIVIQQRGHERDLAGALLSMGGYEVLRLPNEYDPRRHCATRWWADPRRTQGELLCPARVTEAQTAELKTSLGEMAYEAQFQQNPVPPAGGILKEAWWRYWVPQGHPLAGKLDTNGNTIYTLPKRFQQRIQTWDMTFKKTLHGSYVCGQAWGRWRTLAFLLGQFRERVGFVDTVAAVKDLVRQFPSDGIYVEGKANGPAVIDTLRLTIPGLIDSNVETDKVSRAHAASPRVQAGNFVLPHPEIAPWVRTVLQESKLFPNAANDDIVDTITMADRYLFIQQPFTEKNFAQGADHGI